MTILPQCSWLLALRQSSQLLRTQHLGEGTQSGLLDWLAGNHSLLPAPLPVLSVPADDPVKASRSPGDRGENRAWKA